VNDREAAYNESHRPAALLADLAIDLCDAVMVAIDKGNSGAAIVDVLNHGSNLRFRAFACRHAR
jgi:hypothetical protein